MNPFDYVKYDDEAYEHQSEFKFAFHPIETMVETRLKSPRVKALIMTKLEEAYCWVGKAVRDDQIVRNGSAELEEQRGKE